MESYFVTKPQLKILEQDLHSELSLVKDRLATVNRLMGESNTLHTKEIKGVSHIDFEKLRQTTDEQLSSLAIQIAELDAKVERELHTEQYESVSECADAPNLNLDTQLSKAPSLEVYNLDLVTQMSKVPIPLDKIEE